MKHTTVYEIYLTKNGRIFKRVLVNTKRLREIFNEIVNTA